MGSTAPDLFVSATYADWQALPEHIKGEIIDGVLYTQPRPRVRHSRAAGLIYRKVSGKYGFDADEPGGWWILMDPGIELLASP